VKKRIKALLHNYLSGFLPFQAFSGALRYYYATQENQYRPEAFLYYGKNVRIGAGVEIGAPERLYVGDNVAIDPGCYIQAVGGCYLGRGCQLSAENTILTVEHQHGLGESLPFDPVRLVKPVYIENYVWTGVRVCIAPGVRIGEGAIVGMGSVVLQDVPPCAIVVGNPAQVVTYRSKSAFVRAKEAGTAIDPYKELPLLKVPPIIKRKYKNELAALGFDVSNGQEFFRYDKLQPPGKRLVAVKPTTPK
jgi:acetyltransferase-like isoleucine patch superfamily enzyme